MKRIFILHSLGMTTAAREYSNDLEKSGHKTYVPARDTNQTNVPDILRQNREGMFLSDEVHVLWDLSSLGSMFDLGMAYAMRKPVFVVKTKKHHWVLELVGHTGRWLFKDGEYVE